MSLPPDLGPPARTVLRGLGAPARALLVGLIRVYRVTLAGVFGGQCRFHPTCSAYAEGAIRSRGAVVGAAFAVWRLLRCQPFGRGGVDPVPGPSTGDASRRYARAPIPSRVVQYDIVIPTDRGRP